MLPFPSNTASWHAGQLEYLSLDGLVVFKRSLTVFSLSLEYTFTNKSKQQDPSVNVLSWVLNNVKDGI